MKMVYHSKFGQGVIISETEKNVIVEFSGSEKSLIKRFSGLTDADGTLVFETAKPVVEVEKWLKNGSSG